MSKNNMKLLLTGGHARSTAYAVIGEIKKRKKKWDLHFVGSRSAIEGTMVPTLEVETFPKMGVKFTAIFTGRVQRRFTLWTIPSLLKIPIGFLHAAIILLKTQPNAILSFGGFSAFPVVVVGWLFRIPIVIHEQTAVVGRANKYSSPFATKIALSRFESKKYFPKEKVVITGNPVSRGVLGVKPKRSKGNPTTIFVTGGQTGSVVINTNLEEILSEILGNFKIVHQVGSFQYEKFLKLKNSLPSRIRKKYEVHSTISPDKWAGYISRADIIISRSGANIVSEILVAKRPSILIPLPMAYLDEQKKNAEYAKEFGIAKVIEQRNLTSNNLLKNIKLLDSNWKSFVSKAIKKKSPDISAASSLCDLVEEVSK